MTAAAYVALIGRGNVGMYWPIMSKLLAPAVRRSRGRFTLDGLLQMVTDNGWDSWLMGSDDHPGADAAAVAGIVDYPGARAYSVFFLGGREMRDWLPSFLGAIEARAKELGCSAIETGGRRGWKRLLSRYGYLDTGEVRMEKEV